MPKAQTNIPVSPLHLERAHPPESPEGAAWELFKVVERRERRHRGRNTPDRTYILDLFAECLAAAQGQRRGTDTTMH